MSLEHVILPNGDHRWFLDGKLLSLNHVSVTVNGTRGEFWYRDGKLHRDKDEPAEIIALEDDVVEKRSWYRCGKLHRDGDKPAILDNTIGNDKYVYYYKDGELHRDGDKPAAIEYSDTQATAHWHINGENIKHVPFLHNEHGDFIFEANTGTITGKLIDDAVVPLSEEDIKICRTLKYKGKDGTTHNFKIKGVVPGTDFVSRLQEFSFSGDGSDVISIIGKYGCSLTVMLSGLKQFHFTGNMSDILSSINQASDKNIWQKVKGEFSFSFEGGKCPITGIIMDRYDFHNFSVVGKNFPSGKLSEKDIMICEQFGLKISLGY